MSDPVVALCRRVMYDVAEAVEYDERARDYDRLARALLTAWPFVLLHYWSPGDRQDPDTCSCTRCRILAVVTDGEPR